MRNWTKTLTSDMSGPPKPVQEDKSLSAKRAFPFFFFRSYTFPIVISKFIILITKFITLYKITSFMRQIYDPITKSHVLLGKFMIFNVRCCVLLPPPSLIPMEIHKTLTSVMSGPTLDSINKRHTRENI